LVRANKAIYDYTTAYGVPCISGKDSMKNDYQIGKLKIPSPDRSVLRNRQNQRCAPGSDDGCQMSEDLVYVIGETRDEMGGSEWFALHNAVGNNVPKVDAACALKMYRALNKAIEAGLIASCHDCSDGGLAVALCETAFAGSLGMSVNLNSVTYQAKSAMTIFCFRKQQAASSLPFIRQLKRNSKDHGRECPE